ncbi:MAG: aldose 1-epimerase family protein [Nocardioides sp.]
MVAPSGEQLVIAAGGYRAVVTESGAGLRELEHEGRALVAGYPVDEHASGGRGQQLLPWPNRIADGRYRFEGRDLQLPITEVSRGHASHGLTRWTAWRVVTHSADSVELGYRLMAQPGYPWSLDLSVRYVVSEGGLTTTVTATNLAADPAPFAAGAHPYLSVGPGPVDAWQLEVPADTALRVDERKIPVAREAVAGDLDFRTTRPVGDTVLDTPYTDLARDGSGHATVTLRGPDGAVQVWMDDSHHWVQVYTADELPEPRSAIAIEPMTAPPNAFNSGDDLVVLAPAGSEGDSVTVHWGIRAL